MHIGLRSLLAVLALFISASPAHAISNADYYNRVRGAWLGKCIGGALGMPLESWSYADIDARYPNINGYVGYVRNQWLGWSGILRTERIGTGSDWCHFTVALTVPNFDTSKSFAVPIIGMSLETSTAPASWQIRDLKVIHPRQDIPFDSSNWSASDACSWTGTGTVQFDFKGQRSWLKLAAAPARSLRLNPGDTLLMSFDAKWISGDDRIGFAFDYLSNDLAKGFGPDDDTSYQIVGLHTLETRGPDISCKDIGREWCDHLPAIDKSLAEGLALSRLKEGIAPPESGDHPVGEAIGGQMKGEIWGLICPGRPDLAAEFARRDGVVAHCRNGVYGEQFIAAMIAAAFTQSDVNKLIETGLSVIPRDSQYAQVVREVIAWHAKYPDYRDTRREIKAKYPGICNPVYAEAGIVTLALLYGNGDFDKSIRIAASCGSDTDCNTASVGALLGCIHGTDAIPPKWKDPIDDTFRCFVIGMENWRISDLSKRICTMGRKVEAYHGSRTKFSTKL